MSARAVAELAASLSSRDQDILLSVGELRFMTTKQIERLHFTDHATPLAAARICRRVLKRLQEARLLHHLDRRVGGVRAGSAGYVWSLGLVGDHILRHLAGDGVRRRLKEPSTTFVDHTLAIAEAHVALVEASRSGLFELIAVDHEPSSWRSFSTATRSGETLRPDLYVVTASGAYEDVWFIEIDRGTESLPALLRKCAQYQAYRQTGREQAATGTYPVVVWVLPHDLRIAKLQDALDHARQLDSSLFRLTTPDQLAALLAKGPG
jgi:Replication-relaxation